MTSLLSLPAELIPSILRHLHCDDLFSARLSNKYVESSSFSYFGKRFFRKKGYLITSPSLNILKSIAAHEELRKYVEHVWFNPDLYTFVTPKCAPDPHWPYSVIYNQRSEDDEQKYDVYQDCIHDHKGLLGSSKLEHLLTGAFATLPNLVTVGMRRSEDHRPWGWSKLKDAVGEDPRVLGSIPSGPMSTISGPSFLFIALTKSLANANVRLTRLYTDAIEIDNILADATCAQALGKAFNSLLYLEINASSAWLTQKAKHQSLESGYGSGLVKLLQSTPKLLELGLQIWGDRRHAYMIVIDSRAHSWRYAYPRLTFQGISSSVQLGSLTRIKLEKITTTSPALTHFLTASRGCLQSLKIRDVGLHLSDGNDRPGQRVWKPVFEFLYEDCPALAYILFNHLTHELGGVSFVEPDLATRPGPPDQLFVDYSDITAEAKGRDAVRTKLETIVHKHWYLQPILGYAMDESLWHSDTSEEEW